ncbi:MAG TPA: DUF2938 domain-containing protein [Steroidobacteraceae bacterium]|nr:DUF2938 domain-containing protein [Steroidobacteraceae bacterium]
MEFLLYAFLVGCGATALVDLWALLRRSLFGMPLPDFGHLGRWLGHMPRGRFRHAAIAEAAPVPGEKPIGWIAHYVIGIAFAALLLAVWGIEWLRAPTPGPALTVGVGTVVAPYFIMQPAMGAGIAASRTPRPAAARLHSLLTHAVFGVALFLAGWVASRILF